MTQSLTEFLARFPNEHEFSVTTQNANDLGIHAVRVTGADRNALKRRQLITELVEEALDNVVDGILTREDVRDICDEQIGNTIFEATVEVR